jgi:parallel beta-helix repeat protein
VRTVSGMMLMLLLVSMLSVAFNIRQVRSDWTWTETIHIRADGNIYPATAPISSTDNVTYTLTDNIIGNVPQGSSVIIIERDNITIDGAGYTVQGTYVSDSKGVYLDGRNNVTIRNMTIGAFYYGIELVSSSSNSISGNKITNNRDGIVLFSSSNNSIGGNNVTNNNYGAGITVYYSSNYNSISGNNITNNGDGIQLLESSNSTISVNNITNNRGSGIVFDFSLGNSISGNSITDNYYGVWLGSSSGNSIFHNSFVNNNAQVYSSSDSVNVWDNGYPCGGNYWSDYNGTDSFNGAYQNMTGSDGIGDTPYIIDANNTDGYPFMPPWGTGDIDGHGEVTLIDLVPLAMAYGSRPGQPKWNPNADINNNGIVNFSDLVSLAKCYGKTYT